MKKLFFCKVGVAAGDGFESVFGGVIDGIQHYIFTKIPVEPFPSFGILGHMNRRGAQPNPQIVHHFKGPNKNPALGHDLIKKISMGDEYSFFYAVVRLYSYFAYVFRNIAIVMVPPRTQTTFC
jgi:hypothetical protein